MLDLPGFTPVLEAVVLRWRLLAGALNAGVTTIATTSVPVANAAPINRVRRFPCLSAFNATFDRCESQAGGLESVYCESPARQMGRKFHFPT